MTQAPSLAKHLDHAARLHGETIALHGDGRTWTFAELLTGTRLLATTLGTGTQPLIATGNSHHLAHLAYAASFENRPFWPVDRSKALPDKVLCPPETALIISTSGSEGQARAVLLGNTQLDAAASAANHVLSLGAGDLWLNCLPLHHIGGQAILWRCARAAAGMLLHDGFVSEAIAADFKRYPVTHISLVPAMLARLIEADIRPPPSLRVALIGGAALSPPLYAKALAAGWPLYPSYGMSETAALLAVFKPGDGDWHAGLVGQVMPGHDIRITGAGRIVVRGPQVMSGYLDGSGVDAEGWLLTGDLGKLDPDGRLTVTGRADDMLISGGRNVHPLEVESCLAACPGVRDIAVTGLPDDNWGDLVVALVVGDIEAAALRAHARQHLPSSAQPRRIGFLEALPRNAAGKLERPALRRLAAEIPV